MTCPLTFASRLLVAADGHCSARRLKAESGPFVAFHIVSAATYEPDVHIRSHLPVKRQIDAGDHPSRRDKMVEDVMLQELCQNVHD